MICSAYKQDRYNSAKLFVRPHLVLDMKIRTFTVKQRLRMFLLATLLASPGILFSLTMILMQAQACYFSKYGCSDDKSYWTMTIILYSAAWLTYFTTSYYWVKYRRVPVLLYPLGLLFGCSSILISAGFSLILVFPAIFLMLRILMESNDIPEINSINTD